jgi:T5SS/PEP-CTERM-associated repeat protein
MKNSFFITSTALVLFLCRITNLQAQPSLLTWSSFDISSDLSGLAGNLENGQPANIFGGVGSGLAWAGGNSFVMSPDRGPNAVAWNTNVDNTTSYISRLQNVTLDLKQTSPGVFSLTPTLNSTTLLYSTTPLNYNYYNYGATSTVAGADYYFNGRSDNFGAGNSLNSNNARFDPEAVRVSSDGRYVYVSDEYGPYVYQFDRETGARTKSFVLPDNLGVTNQSSQGSVEIASNTTGRVANKGMEGLAISPDGTTLFGFMQGPLLQDSNGGGYYNRIVKIDIATGRTTEYAYDNRVGGTNNSSELLAINDHQLLVLERDSKGLGDGTSAAVKDLIKIDLSGATDVTGLSGSAALASNAVSGTVFLDIVAALNSAGIASSNIPAKLEGIAWGQDVVINGTNTHTLYMANDNDFVTNTSGPSKVFVFGVTDADLGGSTFANQAISFQLGGDLYVGSNSTVPPVSYSSGTNFYNNVYVGYEASASNNQLVVANPGTILTNSGNLYVGFSGSGNSLVVSNGATVASSNGIIGYSSSSSGNSVLITGNGSLWTNTDSNSTLAVGFYGNLNTLTISNGGMVVSAVGTIGLADYSSSNAVVVTGSNSLWSNSVNLELGYGYFSTDNTLTVSNGGNVTSSQFFIANDATSSNNKALVTGTNSQLSASATFVGEYGVNNSLIVSNGGSVSSPALSIGAGTNASNNTVVVTDPGSLLSSDQINIGLNGVSNSLVVSNQATVSSTITFIGNSNTSSFNSLLVTGTNSLVSNSSAILVGYFGGSNSLTVSEGGNVFDHNAYIGYTNGSSGNSALVTDENSTWNNSGNFYVGYFGDSNSLVISNVGKVLDQSGSVGFHGDGNSAIVTGTNSVWSNAGSLNVGNCGSDSLLVVSNGGGVVSSNGYIAEVSKWSNCGAVITGSGSYWSNLGTLTIGSATNAGNNPSSGNSLLISDGGVVTDTTATIASVTNFYGNSATVTGSNSLWSNSGDLYLGYAGSSNSLIISNGGLVSDSNGWIGYTNSASSNSVLVTGSNSLWTNSGDLYVGNLGSSNTLVVSNGAIVASSNGLIGYGSSSSGNSVVVTGNGSLWTNTDTNSQFYVGVYGGSNSLSVSDGGVVADFISTIGYGANSSSNVVLVTGANSVWTNAANVYLGFHGSGNSLTISNGATVDTYQLFIACDTSSSNNTVIVTGSNSTLNASGSFIGETGGNNSMIVSNHGSVIGDITFIGDYSTSSSNSVLVTGTNSLWSNSSAMLVGYMGSSNSLVICDAGAVNNHNGYIGYGADSKNNSVILSGMNSLWSNAGYLYVGDSGSGNSLTVSNGGEVVVSGVSNNWLSIGENDGANSNTITVNGSNSQINVAGWLEVGWGSNSGNQMIISNGGLVSDSNGYIGYTNGSSGNSVLVTGTNSSWTNQDRLYVGYLGSSNSLVVSNGGQVLTSYLRVGHDSNSIGNSILVTGTNSLLESGIGGTTNISMRIGANGVSNSLTINQGGLVLSLDSISIGNGATVGADAAYNSVLVYESGTLSAVQDIYVGYAGLGNSLVVSNGGTASDVNGWIGYTNSASNNSVLVTGSSSLWTNSGDLYVGNLGSSNTLVISNGAIVASSNGLIGYGSSSSGNSVVVTGNGSLWTNTDTNSQFYVGVYGGNNRLTISDGGVVADAISTIGYGTNSISNSVLVTGSNSSWSNRGIFVLGGGDLTLANDGLLTASQIQIGQYGALNFGRLGTNDSAGSVVGDIVFTATNDENSGINFNQTNSFNFSNNVSGPGWVCALGNGTTIMSGSNTYSQYTKIDAGTIITTTTNALGTGYVFLAGGTNSAALLLSNNLTISSLSSGAGGSNNLVSLAAGAGSSTLTINGSDRTNYDGVISGALSLVRTGTGTTILTGNNPFSGSTLINGGTLVVEGTNGLSPVTVASGGTLAGNGLLGAVTVTAGGTISPSSVSGTPSILSMESLSLESGSVTSLNVVDPSQSSGTGYDQISVTHGLTFGGSLYLYVPTASGAFGITLFRFANEMADPGFAVYLSEGASRFTMTENNNVWSTADGTYTFSEEAGQFVHSVVPEPSATTLLMISGIGLLLARNVFKSSKKSEKWG